MLAAQDRSGDRCDPHEQHQQNKEHTDGGPKQETASAPEASPQARRTDDRERLRWWSAYTEAGQPETRPEVVQTSEATRTTQRRHTPALLCFSLNESCAQQVIGWRESRSR